MGEARQQLLDLLDAPDVGLARPLEEVLPLQLQAADEYLTEHRARIPVLDRRARDAGIDAVKSLDDIVPLLFSHTTYKSYPQSFLTKGRWDRLLQWLDTLSGVGTTDADVSGVTNIDEWIDRVWAAGHFVYATSGTSGKCSLLNQTAADRERSRRWIERTFGWPRPLRELDRRRIYFFGPGSGPNRAADTFGWMSELFGRPGEVFALIDELRVSEVLRIASMRQAMAEGTATPADVAGFEAETAARTEQMNQTTMGLAKDVVEHRTESLVVSGLWAQHWAIVQAARAMGVPDGEFHPDTLLAPGGGLKGVALPPDYREQIFGFFGDVQVMLSYGMTETASPLFACEATRYHLPAWLILLVLDQLGERLLDCDEGVVVGRAAFLDLTYEGRWGGVITSDKVTVDFSACPCGRAGPAILEPIHRYGQLGEDDKIDCAGTIDSYVRGVIGE